MRHLKGSWVLEFRTLGPWGDSAAYFDGKTSYFIPDANDLLPRDGMTIEAWVWLSGEPGTIGRVASVVDCWGLGFRHDANASRIRFTHWAVQDYVFQTELPNRNWVHVAVAVDGERTARLFVNGQFREEIAGKPPNFPSEVVASIGSSSEEMGEPLQAGLAHLAIYSHALSAEQIRQHHHNALPPSTE